MSEKFKSIDLFAGIGGIRLGFDEAFGDDIKTVFVSEFDANACKTYKANFPSDGFDISGDITKIDEHDVPDFDICLAGFPCQAFSIAGHKQGFNDSYRGMSRGTLFHEVVRICELKKPKVIFCENVKGLILHDHGNTFKVIKGAFEEIGYHVYYKVLNSQNFGVPQNRERIYLVCFRNDVDPGYFKFPDGVPGRKPVIRDILEKNVVDAKYYLSTKYLECLKRHRERNEAKGNGFGYVIRDLDDVSGAIVCGGMGRERNLIIDKRLTDFTPTTHIHGEVNREGIRKMTPREWARLQGFPETYKLVLSDGPLYKQFGNSVTVPVIRAIAEKVRDVLEKKPAQMQTANKGEWSEVYAFAKLLKDGRVYSADEDAKKREDSFFNIMEIFREDKSFAPDAKAIKIYQNGSLVGTYSEDELEKVLPSICEGIISAKGASFALPQAEQLMNDLGEKCVKAPSDAKSDIIMKIRDPRATAPRPIGFSIKSYLGGAPTLWNASHATKLRYRFDSLTDEQKAYLLAPERTFADVKEYLKANHVVPVFDCVPDETCNGNFLMCDSSLPQIIGNSELLYYFGHGPKCADVLDALSSEDPLSFHNAKMYEKKFVDFLVASALGMVAKRPWDGTEEANGGYIIVKNDGDVLCYHIYDRDIFRSYLLKHVKFDTPDSKKYLNAGESVFDGHLYEEDGKIYFLLNLQIRFDKEG
jgi:DNA-cytosine methyltransferase